MAQPLHQWKLDGNANDSAGGRDGTATNVTYQAFTKATGNYSANFNLGPYINIPYFKVLSYTNYSVSFWLKNKDHTTNGTIWSEASGTNFPSFYIFIDRNEQIQLYLHNSPNEKYIYTGIRLDFKWHHLTLTDANGSTNWYLDGALKWSESYTRSTFSGMASNNTYFGAHFYSPNYNRLLNGNLNDMRFYDIVLTETEVKQLYSSYFTEKAASMMELLG